MPVPDFSQIEVVDVASGKLFPLFRPRSAFLSSAPFAWRGIVVEGHRREPWELQETYLVGYGLMINTSKQPISFGWKQRGGWRDRAFSPGEFHLVSDGEYNTPRWLQAFDEMSLVLDPHFVEHVIGDGLPGTRVELAGQRWAYDPTIVRYADAFRCELEADAPNGSLYAEALTIGFALHLLSTYGVRQPRLHPSRGKLNPRQLHSVIEFIQSHLGEDISLLTLADQAHVSPSHFAHQFRATVGLPPHQYVLRQRLHRSLRLIKDGRLPLAQIAIETGFHDQPHLTRTFRRLLGTTPAEHFARR